MSPLKLNDTPENRDMTVLCNQSDIGVTGKAVVPFEAKNDIQVKNVPDSEDLQNALALLYRKRQELVIIFQFEVEHKFRKHINFFLAITEFSNLQYGRRACVI